MDSIKLGLLLMIVGMVTVFAILLIVIYLGKALIFLINRYIPEKSVVKVAPAGAIPDQETAAIISAVSFLTGGKGKVTKIEKT